MQKLSPKYAEGEDAKEKINRSTCSIPRGRTSRMKENKGRPRQLNVRNEDEEGERKEEGEMFERIAIRKFTARRRVHFVRISRDEKSNYVRLNSRVRRI